MTMANAVLLQERLLVLMDKGKAKKIIKTLDIVLIILGVFLALFIVSMVIIFIKYQAVPDTLIEQVLDTSKFELIAMAAITIVKTIVKGRSNDSLEDSNDSLENELGKENLEDGMSEIIGEVLKEEKENGKRKRKRHKRTDEDLCSDETSL